MGKEVNIRDIIDSDGLKLPPNMTAQFRNLQSGVEYLKDSADNITVELKGVSKKLGVHTTDLSVITKKVNEIDYKVNELSKKVSDNFNHTSDAFKTIINILTATSKSKGNPKK